ncbi:MAG: hypothetical protein ACREIT_09630, partial [Tepidisphaeraceae bacterium]
MLGRNVLIFHAGALGDFVVTWPLALALGRLFPQSRVMYVVPRQKGELVERVLRVESVDVEGGWHALFADAAKLPERQAKTLAGAHTVVSFVSTGADAWADNVRRLAPEANLICLDPRPPAGHASHVTSFHLEQLRP